MNDLIMLVGVSGSGKSTLAKMLKEGNDNMVIVSSDAVRAELLGDENDQSRNGEVFNEVHKRIISSLKEGKDVIYDATNLSYKRRTNFLKTISHLNVYKKCIVVLSSYERCVYNQTLRDRKVPSEVIKRQIKQFQCPYWYEGWDDIKIYANDNISLNWFMDQNKIPHDNLNHSMNIYDHMVKARNLYRYVVDEDNYDKLVEKAVLYHDIGKFFCKEFKTKDGAPDKEAHYYNHHNVGAYFYLLDLNNIAEDGLNGALYTAILIQWHMEFYLRDKKGMDKLSNMLGLGYSDLEMIHNCDVLAK